MQKRDLEAFVAARGWEILGWYEDVGTGRNDQRLNWKRLMSDARSRRFDIMLCWKLDRAFRSLKGIVLTLSELTDLGVQFASVRDQIDLTTSTGRLMTNVIASFAEFEADLIRERVTAGLETARAEGTRLGRPQVDVDQDRLVALKASGFSVRQISSQLGLSKSHVHRALAAVPKTLEKATG
jgi:DNA invertase Pin-like site-specific DNA recombinase